ncbi:MAG TPA: DUF6265 family protein [Allosphingosinicella sp.]|jgi:hypothetical protein
MGKVVAAVLAMFLSTGFSILMPLAYELRWLGGHWVRSGPGDEWSEEWWTGPRGDLMLGTGVSGKGLEVKSWEFMRIQGNAFWGAPRGQVPVEFPIVDRGPGYVVFENPKHDYPTRISYRLEGKVLVATISGPGGADPQTWRYRRMRDWTGVTSRARRSGR